jgi:nucleoside-diphosphate-sugar epimerase
MINALSDRLILITGAGGFIGGWTAELLHLEGRWRIRAGVRRWASASRIARFPMEVALCDVQNPASLKAAMKDVNDVVHCATGDAATIVNGTRNVLEAAAKSGARVIHLSSIAVYGHQTGTVDESCAFASNGSEYSAAKIESELLCAAYQRRGVRSIILRPTIVYGPYSTLWTTNIALRLLTRRWGSLGPAGDGTCNLVYVHDLVHAIRCALQQVAITGETFNINGPNAITWNQYFAWFNTALGLPELSSMSPSFTRWKSRLLYPARYFGKFMLNNHRDILISVANRSRRIKSALKSSESAIRATATSEQLQLYKLQASYPSAKAQRVLSYRPTFEIPAGIYLSCAWLRHAGVVQ